MRTALVASLLLGACTAGAPIADGGMDGGIDGDVSVDAMSFWSDLGDTPFVAQDVWWTDAEIADDVGSFVPSPSCDLGDPDLSVGTYPATIVEWPNTPVYEATILALRTSRVSTVTGADLDRTLLARCDAFVYSWDESPATRMPDAGPPGLHPFVGADLTIELPDLGTLAVGDRIYVGNIGSEYFAEAPYILITAEAVRVDDHPSFVDDLFRIRAYEDDVNLYERARHATAVALVDVNDVQGPFDCQFLVEYDYRAGVDVERVLCGTMPTTPLGLHTARTRYDVGWQQLLALDPDMPSACAFPPDGGVGDWTMKTQDVFAVDQLSELVRLLTTRPSLSL